MSTIFHGGTTKQYQDYFSGNANMPLYWTGGPMFALIQSFTDRINDGSDILIWELSSWSPPYFRLKGFGDPMGINDWLMDSDPFEWVDCDATPFKSATQRDNAVTFYQGATIENFINRYVADNTKAKRIWEIFGQ